MLPERIVITGAGVVSPIGIGLDAYWESLVEGRSGIRSLADRTDEGAKPKSDSEPLGLWIGAPIVDFDAKPYVRPRKSLKVMCREIQTAFAATQMAMEQANLEAILPATETSAIPADRIGTVFGSEMFYGPPDDMVTAITGSLTPDGDGDLSKFGALAMREIMPLWMLKYLPNMPACHFGISINALGPNNTLVLGEVSGPAALIESVSCITRGIADIVFCGASGTRINTTRMNYRGDMPIPCVRNENGHSSIANASRPHHPDSTGVIAGEAAASLVLESESSASKRGQASLAIVSGMAARFSASPRLRGEATATEDRGSCEAIRLAIVGAIQNAGLKAEDISLVISQAMGDSSIDSAERRALAQTLKDVPAVAPVASMGHSGAAIGTVNLVTGLLALVNRVIPPTLNAKSAAPEARLLSQPQPLIGDHVLCLSHTSEGNAIAIILSRPS